MPDEPKKRVLWSELTIKFYAPEDKDADDDAAELEQQLDAMESYLDIALRSCKHPRWHVEMTDE